MFLLLRKSVWPLNISAVDTEYEVRWVAVEVRLRRLPVFAVPVSSPTLPLPVEFVAGGEGRPVSETSGEPPGLGGSGNRGKSGGVELEDELKDPMKMADKGRCLLRATEGRGVIGRRNFYSKSSRRVC